MIPPTLRQLDVARCLAAGMTEPKAADALGIGHHTVKKHTVQLRYRLRAKTTTHAVAECLRRHLID